MKKSTFALLFLSTVSASYAKDEKIQHDAHQHGVAEINIVRDKEDVNIELLSPAFNIAGFEYQPANHEQEEAIAQIEKKLNAPNELFSFTGASCKTVDTDIHSPFEEEADHEDHDQDEHAKHDKHDDHGKNSSSTHSEYSIHYQFSCANSEAELAIAMANLFKYFPQMEKINVQWLSPTQQSSSILTKKNTSITLK